ncbi:GNAT family N-acetyltransferase [Mycobacterium crocinum]|uniref:GNAT family N-acetyltransferase n=1 Tax=Mycolicibacterium crocinum TaxID=388459 RepID=UPI0023E00F3B|nr:GNAT family N-acetyltransferase [Mycolicibacterium crocinum]
MSRQSSPCVHSRRPVCTLDGVNGLRFVPVDEDDPLAQPLLAELAVEYATRYEAPESGVARWLRDHPADQFRPPDGGMVIGLLDGQPVTGGAFCRFDDDTAELKRIWTDSGHRRRGHAATLLAALEDEIARRGYRRIYLTTGNRQPEAEALYDSTGYRRLDEPLPSDVEQYPIAFVKAL